MTKIRKRISYFCPYCGKSHEDGNWSFDHIIPLVMGGPTKFRIISCNGCNHRISQQIEQPAMQMGDILSVLGELGGKGFKIKSRRKEDYLPYGGVGVIGGSPARFFYNRKENYSGISILGLPKSLTWNEFMKRISKGGVALFPVDEDNEHDTICQCSLADKIVLGTCCWLWGDRFVSSQYADDLRKRMWDNNLEDIIQMDSSDHHVVWEKEDGVGASKEGKDAFDNTPHNTIYIVRYKNVVVGLVNIFGSIESMVRIGELGEEFVPGEGGIVIIAKTTKNEVLKMTLEEYKRMKAIKNL